MIETTPQQTAPQEANTQAVSAVAAADKKPKPGTSRDPNHVPAIKSKGEKLYDWGVYDGLNFWANLIGSVVIADVFCNGKGQKWINKGATGIANMVAKSHPEKHAKIFGQSHTALETLSLLSGGWALLIPMKYLEDNKRPIVHWVNDKLGVDQTAPDGHKLNSQEIYIEKEQPKQSWMNVVLRRCGATIAVIAAGQTINGVFRDRAKTKEFAGEGDPFGGKKRIEKTVVDGVNAVLDNNVIPGSKAMRNNGRFQRYLALSALDTIFTKITAVVMEVTNGAKKIQLPTEVAQTNDPLGSQDRPNKFTIDKDGIPDNPPEHDHRVKTDAQENLTSFTQRVRPQGSANIDPATAEQNASFVERAKKSDSYTALTEKNTATPTLAV